jgi:hypothetical protein
MEEEGSLSEKTISDEELDLDQPIEPEEEWEDIRPEESVSQVVNNTNSEVDAGSETSTFSTSNFKGSSVWLYFDKSPSYASGHNVCKRCSKRFKVSTSVTVLRTHLLTHQLRAPTRKQAVVIKKKNPFDVEDQDRHDEFLIQWLICDLQPFTVVDNNHFREFVNFFCPRYTIPDRHKVKGKNVIIIIIFNIFKNSVIIFF